MKRCFTPGTSPPRGLLPGDEDHASIEALSIRSLPGHPLADYPPSPPPPPPPAADRIAFSALPEEDVNVALGPGRLSSRPRVIAGTSTSIPARVCRQLAGIKNFDGVDDLAGAVSANLPRAGQPMAELAFLLPMIPVVGLFAKSAVNAAQAAYGEEYPDRVRACLEQQRLLIDALAPSDGSSDEALSQLERLHRAGEGRWKTRQARRKAGCFSLLKHNLLEKWHHRPGNGRLSQDFNQAAAELVSARFVQDRRLDTPEIAYRQQQLDKAETGRKLAKRARTAAFFTGIGMPGMVSGMTVSAGASSAALGAMASQAAGEVAAQAACEVLRPAAGGILLGSQLAQGTSGLLNFRIHRAERGGLAKDAAAVRAIGPGLPDGVAALFEQDWRVRSADGARRMKCDGALTAGQAMMAGASITSLTTGGAALPVAIGLAVPGAALTIGASIGAAVNDARHAGYRGQGAAEPMKAELRQGDLGPALRDHAFDDILARVSSDYLAHQQQAAQSRLWSDILRTLGTEDLLGRKKTLSALERHQQVTRRNGERGATRQLLDDGVRRLEQLRETRYPVQWFQGSAVAIHERLAREMRRHPATAVLESQVEFRQAVLSKVVSDLAGSANPAVRALFRDDRGHLRTQVQEARVLELVSQDAESYATYLRRYNEGLAKHLVPATLFARADSGEALADLARAKVARQARHADVRGTA